MVHHNVYNSSHQTRNEKVDALVDINEYSQVVFENTNDPAAVITQLCKKNSQRNFHTTGYIYVICVNAA